MKLSSTFFALLVAVAALGLIDARPVEDAADTEADHERMSSEIELQRGLRER